MLKNLRHLHTSHVITSRNAATWFCPVHCCSSVQREKIKIEISNKTINDTDIGKKSIGNKHFKESKRVYRTLSSPRAVAFGKKLISSKSKLLKCTFSLLNSNGSSLANDVNPKSKNSKRRRRRRKLSSKERVCDQFVCIKLCVPSDPFRYDLICLICSCHINCIQLRQWGLGKYSHAESHTLEYILFTSVKMTSNYFYNVSM